MSVKRFNADVRSARAQVDGTGIPHIVSIERGDSDGEFVATFMHEQLVAPIPVRLLAQDINAYPDENNFMLFTDVDDVPQSIMAALDDLQNYTFGQNVVASVRDLSTRLLRALSPTGHDGDTDVHAEDDDAGADDKDMDACDADFYDEDEYVDDDDDIFGLGPDRVAPGQRLGSKMALGVLRKIKQDLRKARGAGAKIGVLTGIEHGARCHLLSLSTRAGKLGVPKETLEAWDVEPSDYIVLLLRLDEPYPAADKLSTQPCESFHVDFRFGKCRRYKPTLESAQKAFNANFQQTAATDSLRTAKQPDTDDRPFKKLFISNSLEQYMNENFLFLFKFRLNGQSSWDEANGMLIDIQNDSLASSAQNSDKSNINVKGEGKVAVTGQSAEDFRTLPDVLRHDSFGESVEETSTILVAMQFATHYFVRCTEYCLRCHRRLDKEFEAMKPFVCPDPLCLFQYITMGFGPSVEHEVLTQPYVVDLLVTLCYASVQPENLGYAPRPPGASTKKSNFPIRDFPTGLRLKAAKPQVAIGTPLIDTSKATDDTDDTDDSIKVSVDMNRNLIVVKRVADLERLSGDTWVVLQHRVSKGGQVLTHQAYIKYLDRTTNNIECEIRHKDPIFDSSAKKSMIEMDLHVYDTEFDDLDDDGKARAMIAILNTLPPVSHLRQYLLRNPHSRLKTCPYISSSALTLLSWIVASNRSFILQVSEVDDRHATDPDLLDTIRTRKEEVIPLMGDHMVQFRFAQSTPDKELRFHRALKELEKTQNQYPTLFAWHGSAVQNWHSILRQGLDFKETHNGRAFGHGVYFSPVFGTSQGYMRASGSWPNSALAIGGVIALCEIINSPEQFVSASPHYVVAQTDWIQCRYLFVSRISGVGVNPNGATTGTTEAAVGGKRDQIADLVPQDPQRLVFGTYGRALSIPMKALPSSRNAKFVIKAQTVFRSPSVSKRNRDAMETCGDTEEEDTSDLEALFSDNETAQPPPKRGIVAASRASSMDAASVRRLTTRRPVTPPMTDFIPGSLDLKTLPRLAVPQWADTNSTKRLTNEIKQLQKIYASTPLHELGWYIDFENVENLFQWIVQLHTFDPDLPLTKDMKKAGVTSVVLELRFGKDYPYSPPFVRVIRPKFLPFMNGGGGHVTIGGALCMELLTSNGWSPVTSMEAVFVSVKMAMSSTDPRPARLMNDASSSSLAARDDYGAREALAAFERAARTHGWTVPKDIHQNAMQAYAA